MIFSLLVIAPFVCALIPACLFFANLSFFREPTSMAKEGDVRVDLLIPARNEAANIQEVLDSVLRSEGIELNVLVYDDSSTDATASLVEARALVDGRVRLLRGLPLPDGWNGKQHACWQLAQASSAPLMLFLDADVRLVPRAVARCVAELQRSRVCLLSGFPRIVMVTWMEWLLLPLIQFVLLGLLPMFRMQRTTKPAYSAGCGQFMLAERSAYLACGGHAAIRGTRHDGLKLPHLFREHGLRTDICDLTHLAHVRMYSSASEVWNGLAKNATEGLGSPGRIVPLTLLLGLGQLLPSIWFLAVGSSLVLSRCLLHRDLIFTAAARRSVALLLLALLFSFVPRVVAALKFKQPLRSALLHPFGVALLLVLQWYALLRQVIGKPVGWRARKYASDTGAQVS